MFEDIYEFLIEITYFQKIILDKYNEKQLLLLNLLYIFLNKYK